MTVKTILITGATSGIGTQTALELARDGHKIYMLVRDAVKGEQVKDDIIAQTANNRVFVIECDLASMESVKKAATEINKRLDHVDVLINNAGGIFNNREQSPDGIEMTFAVNHLGHFLLTMNIMPLLKKSKARVINVSSDAHRSATKAKFKDILFENSYSSIKAYANAKMYNIYFTRSIAERFASQGVTAYSLHPGVVNTGFGKKSTGFAGLLLALARPFMVAPEVGAKTSIYLATEPDIETLTGKYFKNKQPITPGKDAGNVISRNKLWLKSEELAKDYLL